MDRWDRACALCPHLWWFTLDVVYSAKRSYLWTGNTSLCRDEWIACSLNTAGVGWVGVSDIGHWVMWEWNSSADHKQQLWYAHTHQFNIDYLYLLGQSIFFLSQITKCSFVFNFQKHPCTCAMTSCDQMSEAEVMCCPFALSDSEGLSRVGPNTVARLWRDILLMGSFSATLQKQQPTSTVRFSVMSLVLCIKVTGTG